MIAQVQPLTTTRRLSGPFDYALPERPVRVGSIVRVPFGRQALDGVVVGLAEHTDVAPDRLVAPTGVREDDVPEDLVELALWMATEYCSTPARALQLVLPPRGKPRTEPWAFRTDGPLDGERLNDNQRALLEALPMRATGQLPALRRLEARGLVAIEDRQRRRAPRTDAQPSAPVELTADQEAAIAAVEAGGSHLLHGVTGSGKTEVYLRAAAAALARGEGVIVLVPEIALTPQTVGRFQARFGDTVALLHSALGEGERYDEWRRLRTGEARIAVGPRSAVFAPVADLGLVVVDEEHDASFKHEGDPRYDARTVAAERARRAGARLLVGTATPRPETWHALPHLRLPDRVDSRPLPPVRVLDMRGARHPLHPETRRALATARKSIVLLNRRGWSNFLSCRSCGKTWECPNCEVALVLHRAENAHRLPPLRPSRAGARALRRLRLAVGRPPRRRDRARRARAARGPGRADLPPRRRHGRRQGRRPGAARALPRRAVGAAARHPDGGQGPRLPRRHARRRARRRQHAALSRLPRRGADVRADRPAGRPRRARGERGGRVLVQTSAPDAAAIEAASRHDADGFLAGELERRRALGYPPFADLIRVVCSAEDGAAARAAAGAVAAAVDGAPRTEVLGPAPLFRLRGRERFQVVVKTGERGRGRARDRRRRRRGGARPRAPRRGLQRRRRPAINCRSHGPRGPDSAPHPGGGRGAPRPDRPGDAGAPRRGAASSSASTATRCCAAARSRSSSSTSGCAEEVRRMGRLMHDALGIGLAATQVGVMHRVLVYRVDPDAPVAAVVNPVLEWASEEREPLEEGCLSLPGVLVEVERPIHVRVRARDEHGEEQLIEASGLEARVLQHEMDHLDGVLILDRTTRDQRKQAMRALREAGAGTPPLGVGA